jgi:hypothetical protein
MSVCLSNMRSKQWREKRMEGPVMIIYMGRTSTGPRGRKGKGGRKMGGGIYIYTYRIYATTDCRRNGAVGRTGWTDDRKQHGLGGGGGDADANENEWLV